MTTSLRERLRRWSAPQVGPALLNAGQRPPCPICNGSTASGLDWVVDPQTNEHFGIVTCSECGCGITSPAPDDLESYYGVRYYGGRHWITRRYCAWRRMRVIRQSSDGHRGGKLVDIGCGDGSFLLEARRAGWSVAGTEINARIPAPGLEIWGSIADLHAVGPFDCISLWHCLEHLRDPAASIRELVELLRPGGVLVIAVPNAGGWQARLFRRNWLHLDVPRHLHHFGLRSLERLVNQCGLEVRRIWHHEVEYDWFGWIQSALNALMPRPNILFDLLTKRPSKAGLGLTVINVVLAVLLLLPALLATIVSTWAGQGGTIILVAQHSSVHGQHPC